MALAWPHAVMRELYVITFGAQPSAFMRAHSSSAVSHCPAFSQALMSAE